MAGEVAAEQASTWQKSARSDTVAGMRNTLLNLEKDLGDVLASFEKELNG
jgi:hypothetical protein